MSLGKLTQPPIHIIIIRSFRRCRITGVVVKIEPNTNNSLDGNSREFSLTPEHSIFRTEAYQHYLENKEKVVLPRLISARFFTLLWITALLLGALGSIIAFWPLIDQLR